ncbi:MAG: tetratricopeptide repeat protein [Deltaproteobacteria bacterium]|jgi:tetratricopeptide (TPR) repeat protein|nr:tetratricopeptide repeat protein [Deltaproteobacteria bacterium]
MNYWSSITRKDLLRSKASFFKELRSVFPSLRFSLEDPPGGRSVLEAPLEFRGRSLGSLKAALKENCPPPAEESLKLVPAVVSGVLEKMWLKKALRLDRESGLWNRDHFLARLKRLVPPLDSQPRPLKLDDGEGALNLVFIEFRHEWALPQRVLVKKLKALPGLLAVARFSEKRLALLARGGREELRERLDSERREAQFEHHQSPPQIGFASHPGDLAFDGLDGLPHLALLRKANTAVTFAATQNTSQVIAFGDLLNIHGRVTQVLPQDRAILNLGKSMGASAGQVFLVKGEDGAPKGEAGIFETAPAYSIAHLKIQSPGRRIAQGDRLEFLRLEEGIQPRGRDGERDRWSGRLSPVNFAVRAAEGGSKALFALAKLDDYEKLSAMVGEKEAEKQLDLFHAAVNERFRPRPGSAAPWEPGILALSWADPPEGIADELAAFLTGDQGPGKVSLALVFYPSEVLTPESLPGAAKKTLLEAAMTGHEVRAVFGPATLNISGDRLFDEGDLDAAIEEYRRGLILDPAHLNLLNSLGVSYGRLGDQNAAISAFDDILRLDPDNLMASFNKGCSYILSGRHEEAEKALEKAASLDPDNFEVLYQLGKTALELGHTGKALDALNRAAGLKGRRSSLHSLLGQARLLQGDAAGAMDAFKQAVRHNPDDAAGLSSLGMLYLEESGDKKMALSLLRRSVELDPSNSLYRKRLGKLYFEMGLFQEAEHHLKSALEYSSLGADPGEYSDPALLAAGLAKDETPGA